MREVIALGPAAIEGSIKPGDRLVSVNGEEIARENLDNCWRIRWQAGRARVETAGKRRDVVVRPVSTVRRPVCCTASGWRSAARWWIASPAARLVMSISRT